MRRIPRQQPARPKAIRFAAVPIKERNNAMFYFDPWYLLFIAPGLLLAMYAQARISWAYSAAQQVPTNESGAAAARFILDSAGLQHIPIEQTPGQLSDHYDPSEKVVRLSP